VTAPALQQSLEALGLKVELTALPTAPYTDKIQKTNDFEAFLSFGGSEGLAGTSPRSTSTAPLSGKTQLKMSGDQCIYTDQFNAASAVTGAPQDEILHKLALDLNDNLPEIYLWQPNYLHVYTDKLGVASPSIPTSASRSRRSWIGPTLRSRALAELTHILAPIGRFPSTHRRPGGAYILRRILISIPVLIDHDHRVHRAQASRPAIRC
jgi:hypothetical protein